MAGWPGGRVAGWPCGRMAGWPDGWPDGRMAGWPCGRMAGWPDGRVAGWPGGRVAVAVAGPWPGWPATKKGYCGEVVLKFKHVVLQGSHEFQWHALHPVPKGTLDSPKPKRPYDLFVEVIQDLLFSSFSDFFRKSKKLRWIPGFSSSLHCEAFEGSHLFEDFAPSFFAADSGLVPTFLIIVFYSPARRSVCWVVFCIHIGPNGLESACV